MGKRTLLSWLLFIGGAVILFMLLSPSQDQEMSWDLFLDTVEQKKIDQVVISGSKIAFQTVNGRKYIAIIPPGETEYLKLLRSKRIKVIARPPSNSDLWLYLALSLLVPIIIVIFFVARMRKMVGGGGNQFTKLSSKLIKPNEVKTTFKDFAGAEEIKYELEEVVEYLKHPGKFERLGGKVPRGILLAGPSGTGKTLLARAVAGEANVPFFHMSGPEFVEVFVGVGASRVRQLFEEARRASPCLIFIDEIDAVGRSRGAGIGNSHNEHEQTLNQILVEMDGFREREAVIVLAATNRPDMLDKALIRPGRFDRRIYVPLPDISGREAILRLHAEKIPLAPDVDIKTIAHTLPLGLTGADIENMVNEAALIAARKNKECVEKDDLIAARDKVLLGPERRAFKLSSQEQLIVAYHEAGHVIVAVNTSSADPVHRVTIVPHGLALGATIMLPEQDYFMKSKERLLAEMRVCYGGRVAEELVFGSVSTGASNDFSQATKIARAMVMQWGMSSLGERTFGSENEFVFLGRDLGSDKNYSEDMARQIDIEVGKILKEVRDYAYKILSEKKEKLEALAQALLKQETLNQSEILALLA